MTYSILDSRVLDEGLFLEGGNLGGGTASGDRGRIEWDRDLVIRRDARGVFSSISRSMPLADDNEALDFVSLEIGRERETVF